MKLENKIYINRGQDYLKGNLHTHSTFSDGQYSVGELVSIYKKGGYDFLAITDHGILYEEVESHSDFVLLPGREQTILYRGIDSSKGEYTHFNLFGLTDQENLEKYYYYETVEDIQRVLDHLQIKTKCIQFNHPLFSKLEDNEIRGLSGYTMIELYNHKDMMGESGMRDAEWLCRMLLNAGKKLLFTAGDDFHGPYHGESRGKCFGGFVKVRADKNKASILHALQEGDFYPSTGPEIYDYRLEDGVLKIETSHVKDIFFYTNLRKCKHDYDLENNDIHTACYELTGKEQYVWVKIVDVFGKSAWTQPIYFTEE